MPTECTAFIFRHLQKTGGVSVRDFFGSLEEDGLWRSYAEGPPAMLGTRRCAPSVERQRGSCTHRPTNPLALLTELADECAAATTAAPLRAFVELHNAGNYEKALDFADRTLCFGFLTLFFCFILLVCLGMCIGTSPGCKERNKSGQSKFGHCIHPFDSGP